MQESEIRPQRGEFIASRMLQPIRSICVLLDVLFYQMIVLQSERQHSQSVRPRRYQLALNDELDSDVKAYRYLLSLWNENINRMIRCHKECLGEMQPQVKINLSRQQQQSMNEQTQKIYSKLQDKLLRQPISRNLQVKKSYTNYFNCFHQKQNDASQSSSKDEKRQFQKQNNVINSLQIKKTHYFFQTHAKRPMSSKLITNKTAASQTMKNFLGSNIAHCYKVKTVSVQANESQQIQEKEAKTKYLKINLQKTLLKDQLFHSKRQLRGKARETPGQKRYSQKDEWDVFHFNRDQRNQTAKAIQTAKISTKRMNTHKYSNRKHLDEVESMQLQNRIMMINSVPSVNVPQSQGYRPKSKCWQNYFNI